MSLTDAHCHLQVPELAPHLPMLWPELEQLNIHRLVVNGMSEADWPEVAKLAAEHSCILPSFGLHPWCVKERCAEWLDRLREIVAQHPGCGLGEFGLDNWIRDADPADQLLVFREHIKLAAAQNLAASIHCIQAWGVLWNEVRSLAMPERGFLIHAYGGSAEMVRGFADYGAYFSFSPYFMHPAKGSKREAFRQVPLDRLLIETDAPALWPPEELNRHLITHPDTGETINHPANLIVALEGLAQVRNIPVNELAEIVEANANRWLGTRVTDER